MGSMGKTERITRKNRTQKNADIENPAELRRIRFVDGILEGKSMQQAAIDAGYSPVTARQATRDIMPRCREIFRQALHDKISVTKLADTIAAGLEAEATKFFADKGAVTDERNVIDWSERRQYSELAADLMGYRPDRNGLNLNASANFQVVVLYRPPGCPDDDETENGPGEGG